MSLCCSHVVHDSGYFTLVLGTLLVVNIIAILLREEAVQELSDEEDPRDVFEPYAIERQTPRLQRVCSEIQNEIWEIGEEQYEDLKNDASETVEDFLQFLEDIAQTEKDNATLRTAAIYAYDAPRDETFFPLLSAYLLEWKADKIYRQTRFLARPIAACSMLEQIALRLPEDKHLKLIPHYPPPAVRLSDHLVVPIHAAWQYLGLPMDPATAYNIAQFDGRFREACSISLDTHTEIQLLALYLQNPDLQPTYNYFGCSKKACLLCDAMLRMSPLAMRMQGSHGKCCPNRGVSVSAMNNLRTRLEQLVESVRARIWDSNGVFVERPGPASTMLSGLTE